MSCPTFDPAPDHIRGAAKVDRLADAAVSAGADTSLSASVVVAAFTLARWELLVSCMKSALAQSPRPREVVLCIDNNEDLFDRAEATWGAEPLVEVIRNPDVEQVMSVTAHERGHGTKRRFSGGSARNAGVAATTSDIVAIIDDDAWAEPGWLAALTQHYADNGVVAIGGPPLALFETTRPAWFPQSFDWVFGCAYDGLPTEPGPIRHLFGGNMSFRRAAFDAVGGYQSVDFDDLDLCMRLNHTYGYGALQYEPTARIHHFVPAERVTWRYFWRRCLFVNTEKVKAFADMGEAANLSAEVGFALKTSTLGVGKELWRVRSGDLSGLLAAGAIYVGLACAALGNLRGRWNLHRAGGTGSP